MPKVMPVAIRDETGAFIRQMAQGNEALAQLYTRLLAQYEERRMNEAHQKEMMSMREGITQDRIGAANNEWYRRREFDHSLRNPNGAPAGPNYLGPGAAGVANPMGPGTPPPTAAPTSAAPTARPSVYTIDNNPFRQGAGTGTPAAPAPQKTSMSGEAADAYAQAPRGADHQEFSAQSRKPLPTVEQPPRPPKREPPPNTQLPNQPRVTPRQAATRPQGQFLDVDQRWLDLMHQKEDEFNLPRGTMMTTYGVENGGGRQFGKNPTSRSANPPEGIFQFSKDLRDTYKLTDQDIYNPEKMIHWAAYNMRRNADILEKNYGVKLPTTPETIPMFYALHQWGERAGPRVVAAYIQNPEQPMHSDNVMGVHKDAKGNVLSNYTILQANGHKPGVTVKEALQNKAAPWYSAYTQQFTDHAHQPQGKYTSTPAPPPQQTQQPQVGDPNAPRPPGSIPPRQQSTLGANPRLVAAVRGGAELALPPGYRLEISSGHRHGDSGYHGRREAADFKIFAPDGTYISNRGNDDTGLYKLLARGTKTWIMENDPRLQVNWGGAHSTQKRGGSISDIMHFDTGRDRGQLRPDLRMSQLQPLGPNERNAPVQTAQQQPVKVAGATPTPDTTTPPVAPERAIMPAISRIPTSPEVAATFDNKIATAGFDRRTPDAAASVIEQGPSIKAGAGQLAARSDLEYGLPPAQQAANIPLPTPRPDIPQDITPQKSTLAARSDLDYNTPQSKTVTWEDALPTRTAAADVPLDVEVTPATRSAEPVPLNNEIFTTEAPPTMPPRLDAGVVPKQPLPDEFTSATPGQATPDPLLDVPSEATPRMPLPPGFKVPPPALDGGMTAAASAPSGQMPRDMQLPERLPPPLPPEEIPQGANAPTLQRIRDAIFNGNIPSLSTAPGTGPETQKPLSPISLRSMQEAVYGDARPRGPSRAQQEVEYARTATPRLTADIIKQRLDPNKNDPEGDAKQQAFKAAVEQWIAEKMQGASDWWNTPSAPKPGAAPPPAATPPAQPIRTTPDGRPYIPQGEPLKVQPPKGSGPTNTTLSNGPQQGAAPIPAPPGKVNPMTGRVDVPAPVPQAGGGVLWKTPEELAAEQQQPVEQ